MLKQIRFLILIFTLSFFSNPKAQWVHTSGPNGGQISAFAVVPQSDSTFYLLAGTIMGVYKSIDNGKNWTAVKDLDNKIVYSFAVCNNNVFAATYNGIYMLRENEENWIKLTSNYINGACVRSLSVIDNDLYAGTAYLLKSTTGGGTWSSLSEWLCGSGVVAIAAVNDTNIFVGTWGCGIYLTTDNGQKWRSVNNGLKDYNVWDFAVTGSIIFAANYEGVFKSTDFGANWIKVNHGIPGGVHALEMNGQNLYASCNNEVFLSTDNGDSWEKISNGLPKSFIWNLTIRNSNLYAGTQEKGLYVSANGGKNWYPANNGMPYAAVYSLASKGIDILAGGNYGTFRSVNDGSSWTDISGGQSCTRVDAITINEDNIFAGTSSGNLYVSGDNGANWFDINNTIEKQDIRSIVIKNKKIYAGMYGRGIYMSSDNGANWDNIVHDYSAFNVNALVFSDSNFYSGTSRGVFLSTDNGTNWTNINSNLPDYNEVFSLAVRDTNIFAGTYNGVFSSANQGKSWTLYRTGMGNPSVKSLIFNGTDLFAGTSSGVFVSADYGRLWRKINEGLQDTLINTLAINGKNLLAGTNSGVWRRSLSEITTSVKDAAYKSPVNFTLYQNYPNPFNPSTRISFSIPEGCCVKLSVFDMLGKEVAILMNEYKEAGEYTINFDASSLPSGMYIYAIRAGDYKAGRKLLLIK